MYPWLGLVAHVPGLLGQCSCSVFLKSSERGCFGGIGGVQPREERKSYWVQWNPPESLVCPTRTPASSFPRISTQTDPAGVGDGGKKVQECRTLLYVVSVDCLYTQGQVEKSQFLYTVALQSPQLIDVPDVCQPVWTQTCLEKMQRWEAEGPGPGNQCWEIPRDSPEPTSIFLQPPPSVFTLYHFILLTLCVFSFLSFFPFSPLFPSGIFSSPYPFLFLPSSSFTLSLFFPSYLHPLPHSLPFSFPLLSFHNP